MTQRNFHAKFAVSSFLNNRDLRIHTDRKTGKTYENSCNFSAFDTFPE